MTNYPQPSENLPVPAGQTELTERVAENWIKTIYRIAVFVVVILSGLYALSPVDVIPDVLLGPGQVDDIAAVAAGGTSIGFMTMLRFFFLAMMRRPGVRRGCLLALVIAGIMVIGFSVFLFFTIVQFIESL